METEYLNSKKNQIIHENVTAYYNYISLNLFQTKRSHKYICKLIFHDRNFKTKSKRNFLSVSYTDWKTSNYLSCFSQSFIRAQPLEILDCSHTAQQRAVFNVNIFLGFFFLLTKSFDYVKCARINPRPSEGAKKSRCQTREGPIKKLASGQLVISGWYVHQYDYIFLRLLDKLMRKFRLTLSLR